MQPDADLSPVWTRGILADLSNGSSSTTSPWSPTTPGAPSPRCRPPAAPERIGRLLLTNCDAYENFLPGIFKALPPLAKLPGGTCCLLLQPFRISAVTRIAFAPFSTRRDRTPTVAAWGEGAFGDAAGAAARPRQGHRPA